jgi:hypothetical protein
MSSYSEYDLERDLREARRARARAQGRHTGGFGAWLRSRTTDHWIMFAAGFVLGAILF